jgi:type VI secretion system secreted protein VgrG
VGGGLSEQLHAIKDAYTLSAKELSLMAQEQLAFKVGSTTFQVKKNEDVVIKGAKISENWQGAGTP